MSLPIRAVQLIEQFDLQAHPEGGYYKETYRSAQSLQGKDRQLMTSILFLLTGSDVSHFHRIQSDECWYFHEGAPLVVHTLDADGHHELLLGTNIEAGQQPFHLVPANTIFGSAILGDEGYVLVSCAVAPGFDFSEFELFGYEELLKDFPQHEAIIQKLT